VSKERWSSKLGVILAVAGSAVGLGNFLRFPGQVAQNGGGAFMIPYFVSLLLLGLPLMWIEWTIGRFGGGLGHSTAPGMFHTISNKNRFTKYFGVIGIFGPIVIFIYYTYIESWLLGYAWYAVNGQLANFDSLEKMSAFLNSYRGLTPGSTIAPAYIFFVLTFAMNIWIMIRGVNKGIEFICKWGLAALFIFALILVVRVFWIGTPNPAIPENNILNGMGFMWNPDWSALLNSKVWLAAAGQIFFTLSVGIGVILTYASYLKKNDDVALSGLTAAATNEFAEVILGGSLIIPAAFAFFGSTQTMALAQKGLFDLGFVTMPFVLVNLEMGSFFAFLWFALLFLAGLTSSISLAQPAVAFMEDEFDVSKKKASSVFAIVTFILCQPAIFFLGKGVVDELDFWGGTFCLVLFGTVETILFGWGFGMDKAWTELHHGSDITIPRVYRFIIKYITPTFLLVILGTWLFQQWLPIMQMKDVPAENRPYILGTRIMLLLVFIGLAILVSIAWKRRDRNTSPNPSPASKIGAQL